MSLEQVWKGRHAIFNREGLMWFLSTCLPCRWIMQAVRWQAFMLLTSLESFSRFHGVGMGKRDQAGKEQWPSLGIETQIKSHTQGATHPLKLKRIGHKPRMTRHNATSRLNLFAMTLSSHHRYYICIPSFCDVPSPVVVPQYLCKQSLT